MRSFADQPSPGRARCVVSRVIVAACAAWLLVSPVVSAQSGAQTVRARFEAARQSDEKVRGILTNFTNTAPPTDLARQVGQVLSSFEALVRRFPTSGYADDALWHAASLADAAYQRLNRPDDRDRALKLYRWLVQEYPTSTFNKQANLRIAQLGRMTVATVAPAAPEMLVSTAAAPAPVLAAGARATLTSIQRVVLPNAVRVTIELDREVVYREDRLSGPSRLFFDLQNVEVVPALKDKVLSYGSDVVNKIRVGRHPDNTVRVVLDFEEVSKYSVFTLYSPFRVVIDAERAAGRLAAVTPQAPPPPVFTTSAKAAAAPPPPVRAVAPSPAPKPVELREELLAPAVPEAPIAAPEPATPPPSPAPPAANVAGGFSIARQLGLSVSRIVIDPGHGGHDPGTTARGLTEAALTLDIALRLEKLLQKELGVEVVLTRRSDVYVPLEERTAIANRHNADLFLSIHANSSRNTGAKGIETYFLSFASSPEAEAVAARENSASEREMHQLPDLVKAITLNNKLDESRDFANMVQDALVSNLKRTNKDVRSRGVKKAPFVVLIGAAMPSVLAEISFLTNKQELSLLKTSAYKDRIAQALNAAVLRYRRSLKSAAATTVER
jgi:N-acetylmuramoyl-L-alanine amidase